MATPIPFMTKAMQSSPPAQFNTFWKVNVWVGKLSYTTQWALYLAAPGKAEASHFPSRPKQQLVFTATFPISAEGGSYSSHFIALRGHVKDKASMSINKTNVLMQASLRQKDLWCFECPLTTQTHDNTSYLSTGFHDRLQCKAKCSSSRKHICANDFGNLCES